MNKQFVYFPTTVQTGADLERMYTVWCNDGKIRTVGNGMVKHDSLV